MVVQAAGEGLCWCSGGGHGEGRRGRSQGCRQCAMGSREGEKPSRGLDFHGLHPGELTAALGRFARGWWG